MDFSLLGSQLIRAARGGATQRGLSRSLGFESNVVFAWESGRDFPNATLFFRLLRTLGHDTTARLVSFRADLAPIDPEDRAQLASWLSHLRGEMPLARLAASCGRDRFALARFLSGKSEPRLPDFLSLIDALSLSVLDFVALFVDPAQLPCAAAEWRVLENARRSTYDFPWSHAVAVLCRLPRYQALQRHEPGWFASRLGLSIHQEQACLDVLVALGRLRFDGAMYRVVDAPLTVDTRRDRAQTRSLAVHWLRDAARRIELGEDVRLGFNVFTISRADFPQLRELQSRYFAAMRALIADSSPDEVAAVATFSLVELGGE